MLHTQKLFVNRVYLQAITPDPGQETRAISHRIAECLLLDGLDDDARKTVATNGPIVTARFLAEPGMLLGDAQPGDTLEVDIAAMRLFVNTKSRQTLSGGRIK